MRGKFSSACGHTATGLEPNSTSGMAMTLSQTILASETPQPLLPLWSCHPGPSTTLSQIKFAQDQDHLQHEAPKATLSTNQLQNSSAQEERDPWSDNTGTYRNRSSLN